MTQPPTAASNPFDDPDAITTIPDASQRAEPPSRRSGEECDGGKTATTSKPFAKQTRSTYIPGPSDILTVDHKTTLTLGPDALIIHNPAQDHSAAFCGLLPFSSRNPIRRVPYTHILSSSLDDEKTQSSSRTTNTTTSGTTTLTISYAHQSNQQTALPKTQTFTLYDPTQRSHAQQWSAQLLNLAYPPPTQRRQRIKVLINPFGGRGRASAIYNSQIAPLLAASNSFVSVETTRHRGHAAQIAEQLDTNAWDVIACASGDGLPFEVFNGLAKQRNPRAALRRVAVVQLPCGSGNAMSRNFAGTVSPSLAALGLIKGVRMPLDLVAITQGTADGGKKGVMANVNKKEERYFSFLSQSLGIVAETDLGTESLRWMGGDLRFTWGVLVRILFKETYPADVAVVLEEDDKSKIKAGCESAVEANDGRVVGRELGSSDDASAPSKSSNSNADKADDGRLPDLKYGTILTSSKMSPDPFAAHSEHLPDLGNFYAGNLCWMTNDAPFFPTALPHHDGLLDLITISAKVSRRSALKMLDAVAKGTHVDLPDVRYRKVRAYRVTPRPPLEARKGFLAAFGRWLGGAAFEIEGKGKRNGKGKGKAIKAPASTSGSVEEEEEEEDGDDEVDEEQEEKRRRHSFLISVDGERVPCEPFQAEVVPGIATTLRGPGVAFGAAQWKH